MTADKDLRNFTSLFILKNYEKNSSHFYNPITWFHQLLTFVIYIYIFVMVIIAETFGNELGTSPSFTTKYCSVCFQRTRTFPYTHKVQIICREFDPHMIPRLTMQSVL